MKPVAKHLLKRLTVAMCMALVLMGTFVSGHAQAAHVPGINSAMDQPCHHALSSPDTSPASTALDLCREMCLNKIPHEAITAALPTQAAPRSTSELAYALVPPSISFEHIHLLTDSGPSPMTLPPRRASVAPYQRLLI